MAGSSKKGLPREGTPNVVARLAVIKAQDALAQATSYLDRPQGRDQGSDWTDLKEKLADASAAVESIQQNALIPDQWDQAVPAEVCDILDGVVSVISLVHVRTFMQDNGVFADSEAQEVGSLSRRIRAASPGERIHY